MARWYQAGVMGRMLKYYRPSPKMTEKRRAQIASNLVKLLPPKDGHLD